MQNNIRWLLTEARLSNLNTNKINFVDGNLICYHLTSKRKWVDYNEAVKRMDSPVTQPDKEILSTDTKAQRIVKNITNARKNKRPEEWQIEEFVIEDMIDDPYTDTSGFSAGGGDYHGKGLYTCYKFNPKIASAYGNICLVFEIDIKNFIITFEDLAKQVHGENWRIKDQLLKLYQLEERSPESVEAYKKSISRIPDNELEMAKTINSTKRTANISLSIMRYLSKLHITSFYEGIILFGTTDGPVCVSFYPKYDAKLIGLGRLNEDRPEIVDWYDSLNDFVGGRAKLKQDFETINSIAEELTDPAEKAEMKSEDKPPFDMEYLEITMFFNSDFPWAADNPADDMFKLYRDVKSSGNTKKFEFFLKSFRHSTYAFEDRTVKSPEYNELIDEVINYYKKQNKNLDANFFTAILESYNFNNLTSTDLFLKTGIDVCLSDKTFKNNAYAARAFIFKINKYIEKNSVSAEIQSLLNEKLNEFGADIAIMSKRAEKIVEFYVNADEKNKNKIISMLIDDLPRGGTLYWKEVSPENFNTANELLEDLIDSLNKTKPNFNYEIDFIKQLFRIDDDIIYFSNKINEFIASSFLNNIDEIKSESNSSIFVNTMKYIKTNLGSSHPAVSEVERLISLSAEQAGNRVEEFIERLKAGQVTSGRLRDEFEYLREDISCITYLSSQSKDWFKNFFNAVIENITIKNFKVLGKAQTSFLLSIIMSQDIVLTKEEQFAFTRKFGKSDYGNKNLIANYRYIDPDVFIELIGPDLAKGGMGAGLTFKGFEHAPNVYRLLYKHRKIVDLFCDVARPGLMKMIVGNLNDTLMGHPNPQHTWGSSGKLKAQGIDYYLGTLPYLNFAGEEVRISEVINMDDVAWFEYFISRAKKAPKRGVAGLVATLEMNLNDKKLKMQPTTPVQNSDDLNPQLDLSHRKIFGNSLKEVYKF